MIRLETCSWCSSDSITASCHQNERDRMREFLVSWMTLTAAKRKWFKQVSKGS